MARPMDSTLQPDTSKANAYNQNAAVEPDIASGVVIKMPRQDDELLNEEQRRELIATIWREMYGP
jgi:hypothetical protein